MKHNRRPIILVSMPWASASRPNIALGLLVAIARRRGFPCHARYLNLPLASQFDPPDLYEEFANSPKMFPLAEHLFAVDIFGRQALDSDRYLDDIYRATIDEDGEGGDRTGEPHDDPRSDPRDEARSEPRSDPRSDPRDEAATNPLRRLRDEMVPRFLDQCTASLLEQSPDVVGFGCSCAQLMPSLALARRIKERSPETTIIMGGFLVLAALIRPLTDLLFSIPIPVLGALLIFTSWKLIVLVRDLTTAPELITAAVVGLLSLITRNLTVALVTGFLLERILRLIDDRYHLFRRQDG